MKTPTSMSSSSTSSTSEQKRILALTAILDFCEAVCVFETGKPMTMFKAIAQRCVNSPGGAKKVDPEKLMGLFRNLAETFQPFLGKDGALKLLTKTFTLDYVKGKIYLPLGQIIFRSNFEMIREMRKHLLGIGILVAGPSTDVETLKKWLEDITPLPDDDDDEFELDDEDKKFMATIPGLDKIPGVDPKMLMKIGKQNFGNLGELDGDNVAERLKEGLSNMVDSPLFQNVLKMVSTKAENGEFEGMDPSQLMALGPQMFGNMMTAQPAQPQPQ